MPCEGVSADTNGIPHANEIHLSRNEVQITDEEKRSQRDKDKICCEREITLENKCRFSGRIHFLAPIFVHSLIDEITIDPSNFINHKIFGKFLLNMFTNIKV